ncbi:hypothetical protein OAL23_00950, partial [bacterium]|nr:hypothetical protein [bacterium]
GGWQKVGGFCWLVPEVIAGREFLGEFLNVGGFVKFLAEIGDPVIFIFGIQIFEPNPHILVEFLADPIRPRVVMNQGPCRRWGSKRGDLSQQMSVWWKICFGEGISEDLGFFVLFLSDQVLEVDKISESLLRLN